MANVASRVASRVLTRGDGERGPKRKDVAWRFLQRLWSETFRNHALKKKGTSKKTPVESIARLITPPVRTPDAMRASVVRGAFLVACLALTGTPVPVGALHRDQSNGGIDMSALQISETAGCKVGTAGCEVVSPLLTVEVSSGLVDANGTPTPPTVIHDVTGGAARNHEDAFFVWLVHPPSSFWVNLAPTEATRVVDKGLGATDVGKVLLEADLLLKKTAAELLHPDHTLGGAFWNQLYGWVGTRPAKLCHSFRQWIVPGVARLQQTEEEFDDEETSQSDASHVETLKTDGEPNHPERRKVRKLRKKLLHVLRAPLVVRQESAYATAELSEFASIAAGADGAAREMCAGADENARHEASRLFELIILPELERRVNHSPEYETLRAVYLWRVVGEFFRSGGMDLLEEEEGEANEKKSESKKQSCDARSGADEKDETSDDACEDAAVKKRAKNKKRIEQLVNTLRPDAFSKQWQRDTKSDSWTPQGVWDRYVASARIGEFSVSRNVEHETGDVFRRTYFHGGIDLRRVSFFEIAHDGPGVPLWCDLNLERDMLETGSVSLVASSAIKAG